MISRQLAVKIVVPLFIFGVVIGLSKLALLIYSSPTSEAFRRSDTTYIQAITYNSPAMRDTFTVIGVEVKNKHWVIVEVKNKQNNDTTRALLYDPRYSPAYIKVVSPPTPRISFDNLMTTARLAPQNKEAADATAE